MKSSVTVTYTSVDIWLFTYLHQLGSIHPMYCEGIAGWPAWLASGGARERGREKASCRAAAVGRNSHAAKPETDQIEEQRQAAANFHVRDVTSVF